MERSPLFVKTLKLLQGCDMTLTDVANMSGLKYEWLKKLKQGDIDDPSVNKIQTLHDFLASHAEA